MSQPTPYTPTTDFSQQEANNAAGRSTVNTAALDAEFANIENTLDATVNNLALIQRDDGKLSDELVEIQCLSRDVLNLIGGFVNRGDWVTETVYSVNDIVSEGGYLYWCATAHTASALFATDSAKWKKFGFTPADSAASAAAQAAIDAHLVDTTSAHLSTAIAHGASTVSAELNSLSSAKANIASPALTGNPTAPTQSVGNSSTRIANTEFVSNAIAALDFQPSDPDIATVSASQVEMEAGTETALRSMSPLRVKQAIKALAGAGPTPSMVRLHTSPGNGSTNTVIRRITTVVTNQGSDITYADSASLGATFTINTTGIYSINYTDHFASVAYFGISLNATGADLTTSILSIAIAKVLALFNVGSNTPAAISWTGQLTDGDVIRMHTNGVTSTGANNIFTICRVA